MTEVLMYVQKMGDVVTRSHDEPPFMFTLRKWSELKPRPRSAVQKRFLVS